MLMPIALTVLLREHSPKFMQAMTSNVRTYDNIICVLQVAVWDSMSEMEFNKTVNAR